MIYSKLPVVFLNTIASEKQGSTNGEIASYIITRMREKPTPLGVGWIVQR